MPHAIRALDPAAATAALPDLCDILVETVAGGASVNFMAGFSHGEAETFWRGVIARVAEGAVMLFVAQTETGRADGTLLLMFAPQPNQPHRADLGKMLVHPRARRLGLGGALLAAAETAAIATGRTLLTLDTGQGTDADRLYRRHGYVPIGTIPRYALNPDGSDCHATFFYKDLRRP